MSCSAEQINALFDFLDDHRDLARGLLRSADGRLRAKRLWQDITEHLNSLGGSIKTVQQWQKVWTDRKHLAKKNAAVARRSAAGTGGGKGANPLASWELRVLAIMGEGFGAPATTARVPLFPITNFEEEVASYGSLEQQRAGPSSVPDYEEQRAGPSSAPQLVEQQAAPSIAPQAVEQWGSSSTPQLVVPDLSPVPQLVEELADPYLAPQQSEASPEPSHPTSRNPLRAPMRRRRVTLGDNSVTDRLFRYEEEKLEVFRSIQDALHKLTLVITELVELKKKENDRL